MRREEKGSGQDVAWPDKVQGNLESRGRGRRNEGGDGSDGSGTGAQCHCMTGRLIDEARWQSMNAGDWRLLWWTPLG